MPITRLGFSDTIVALCTAQGNGALALIRVSGPQAWDICSSLLRLKSGKNLAEISSHSVHAADIYAHSQIIDSVMIIALRGPKTFTGYDTIEITCHNNPIIIQTIIELIIQAGGRPAQQGEFTRQAYENKKIDLVQAEAINELISAQTQQALKKSLSQLQGSLSIFIQEIEDILCKSVAWCESSFEFLDDEGDFHQEIYHFLLEITQKIEPLLHGYAAQRHIRQGYRVALIGGVNAGKSSLFNLMVGQKRAIISPLAGTTRDSIESTLIMGGITTTFIDTAGLRIISDVIEQEGIERSYGEAHASDIILLVIDGSQPLSTQEEMIYNDLIAKYPQKIIYIQNKSDLPAVTHLIVPSSALIVSSQNLAHKLLLETKILEKIAQLSQSQELPFLVNKRHYELLQTLLHDINNIKNMLEAASGAPHYELISYHLKQALETVSQVTGKSVSENALDRVFKEFCVGK